MAKPMKKPKLPITDSIELLAKFWDTHDSTDFDDDLEEVVVPVFVRRAGIQIPLAAREVKAVEQIAETRGVSREELVRDWVLQQIARRSNGRSKNR